MPVKPATLVVDGDVSRTYQIIEHPELAIRRNEHRSGAHRLRARHDQADRDRQHGVGPAPERQDHARGFSLNHRARLSMDERRAASAAKPPREGVFSDQSPLLAAWRLGGSPSPRSESETRKTDFAAAVQLVGSSPACVLWSRAFLPKLGSARARSDNRRAAAGRVRPDVRKRARADAVSDLEKAHNASSPTSTTTPRPRLRALLDPRAGTLKDADNIADARMYWSAARPSSPRKARRTPRPSSSSCSATSPTTGLARVTLQATDALIDVRSRLREELAAIIAERCGTKRKAKADAEEEKGGAAPRDARDTHARERGDRDQGALAVDRPLALRRGPVPERADGARLDLPRDRVAPRRRQRHQPTPVRSTT